MNRKVVIPLVAVGALVIGIAIGGIGVWKWTQSNVDDHWFPVIADPEHIAGFKSPPPPGTEPVAYEFSDDVFDRMAEIPPPTIKSVKGKAKFLADDPKSNKRILGYVIEVEIEPTDLNKVADKYKHDRPISFPVDGKIEALKNASFEVSFDFELLDKDGFVLQKLKSPAAGARAGETTKIQNRIDDSLIPLNIAKATAKVTYALSVDKDYSLD